MAEQLIRLLNDLHVLRTAKLLVVNPSGSLEELQQKLLKLRDEGLVKFDIHRAAGRGRRDQTTASRRIGLTGVLSENSIRGRIGVLK